MYFLCQVPFDDGQYYQKLNRSCNFDKTQRLIFFFKTKRFTDKKNYFRSLFFVKSVTMFKLLVILFIIKSYARNDLFKLVRK